jgi:hypothetical protein
MFLGLPDPDPLVKGMGFFVGVLKVSDENSRSGSESGSISQRHRFADPDPHQNVMDPEHCLKHKLRNLSFDHYTVTLSKSTWKVTATSFFCRFWLWQSSEI